MNQSDSEILYTSIIISSTVQDTHIVRKIKDHYDILTGMTAKAFSSLRYKELKTNIFCTGKTQ